MFENRYVLRTTFGNVEIVVVCEVLHGLFMRIGEWAVEERGVDVA